MLARSCGTTWAAFAQSGRPDRPAQGDEGRRIWPGISLSRPNLEIVAICHNFRPLPPLTKRSRTSHAAGCDQAMPGRRRLCRRLRGQRCGPVAANGARETIKAGKIGSFLPIRAGLGTAASTRADRTSGRPDRCCRWRLSRPGWSAPGSGSRATMRHGRPAAGRGRRLPGRDGENPARVRHADPWRRARRGENYVSLA